MRGTNTSSAHSESQTTRNLNIDLLRIIACFCVIGQHQFNTWINSNISSTIYYMCSMAVPSFIIITGYYVMHKENITRQYCNRKILNILRVILIWCSITYTLGLIELILKNNLDIITDNPLTYMLKHILGTPDHSNFNCVNMAEFWYLFMLISLYLFIPNISKKSDDKKKNVIIITGALCVAQRLVEVVTGVVVNQHLHWIFAEHVWIFYLMLGYYIQDITNYISKKINLKVHIIIAVIYAIISCIYKLNSAQWFNTIKMANGDYYSDQVEIIWITILVSLILRIKVKESGSLAKVIKFLTPLTIRIYLVHWIISYYVWNYLSQTLLVRSIAFTIIVPSSIFISALMDKLPTKLRDALIKI
jgi:surface polysaccharide O-acyltransferase-like enzyme